MKPFSRGRGFIPKLVQGWLREAWTPTDRYI